MATTDDQFVTAEGLASSLSVVGGGPVVPTAWWYGELTSSKTNGCFSTTTSSYGANVEFTKMANYTNAKVTFDSDGTYLVSLGDEMPTWWHSGEDALTNDTWTAITTKRFLFRGGPSTDLNLYTRLITDDISFEVSIEKVG